MGCCFGWQENYHHFVVRIYKTKQPTNQSKQHRFRLFLCSVYHVAYSVLIKTTAAVRGWMWGARERYKTTIVVGCCCLLCCGGGRDCRLDCLLGGWLDPKDPKRMVAYEKKELLNTIEYQWYFITEQNKHSLYHIILHKNIIILMLFWYPSRAASHHHQLNHTNPHFYV